MKTEIDKKIENGFVSEVNISFKHKTGVAIYRTTFNPSQPEVAIRRALKAYKADEKDVSRVVVDFVRKISPTQK